MRVLRMQKGCNFTANQTIFDGLRQSQTFYGCFLIIAESGCFRAFGSVWIKIGPYRNIRSLWLRGWDLNLTTSGFLTRLRLACPSEIQSPCSLGALRIAPYFFTSPALLFLPPAAECRFVLTSTPVVLITLNKNKPAIKTGFLWLRGLNYTIKKSRV